ncbi:hypothetical protein BAZSYMA_ACONTIG20046_1 [Bathymodiolus azoricus thioautotrophic gill symbiont]|uniref:Uncharacterized protein n=1 Tax=Bathymodiolus azoricus thioautotrophic gill symbiont TaxID=235205 RepID=A0A1H6J7S3_9GAMM|nr:hypothetical protein BAZSYMA_ACONTIG20046_1 [Bathymodiolus azoricus thioautotrophic gill symbiont]
MTNHLIKSESYRTNNLRRVAFTKSTLKILWTKNLRGVVFTCRKSPITPKIIKSNAPLNNMVDCTS